MIGKIFVAGERRNAQAFWLGTVIVTAGVMLHLPMFLMARDMGYRMVGMPMDAGMLWGMWLIIGGVALAAWGLLPKADVRGSRIIERIAPPEDAPLTSTHRWIAALLCLALIIDIMKPASLGFVTPGMRDEYGVDGVTVAWLPLSALIGTAIGSFVWGVLADIYGRRASILLSSVLFVGTSICGAMPSFWWNVFMCWLMGLAAGGMLPVTYALLAEIMPTRHRGWSLVLIGGIGAVGGFFAASALSAMLQPTFGWRIMWFLNLPTGLILIALSPFLPESARFLQQMGRGAEARAMAARFGATIVHEEPDAVPVENSKAKSARPQTGITVALTLAALAWSLVNFGLLLWLPGELVDEGHSVGAASGLIAKSTLLAAPVILFSTWLYSRWSTKGSLVLMLGFMSAGLLGLLARSGGIAWLENPVLSLTVLVIGSCGVIAILLPYAAENYPLRVRARATGWVAGCSKLGGVLAQVLAVLGVVPVFGKAALVILIPSTISLVLIALWGRETRGSDLRSLEPQIESS
jgi:putative MFS transporter